MLDREILDKVKEGLSVNEAVYTQYEKTLLYIMDFIKEKNINFETGNALAFANHMMSLFMRLAVNETVEDIGEEALSQLSKESIAIAKDIVEIVKAEYGEADNAEMALIAIHIFTAMEMMNQ